MEDDDLYGKRVKSAYLNSKTMLFLSYVLKHLYINLDLL